MSWGWSATNVTKVESDPGLLNILGKTWIAIAAIVGAIGLGWVVASMTKRPSNQPAAVSVNPTTDNNPVPVPSETPTPSSTPPVTGLTTPAFIKPTLPAALATKGVNAEAYGAAVKQIFTNQNPKLKVVKIGDPQIQAQVDAIANELGGNITNQLSNDAVRKIGRYTGVDRSIWRSKVNKMHLSERALADLTDAKYASITKFSAQKLELDSEQFLNTPMGQIYQAAMFDRVQAVQAKQAIGEIVFPVGGTAGTVKGVLQPGEGITYLASLVGGQDISVSVIANNRSNLSIYPPSSSLPPILVRTPTNHWTGKTSMNGYHEFVLVSHSDRPIEYELTLTASDLYPPSSGGNNSPRTKDSIDKKPLF